LYLLLSAHICAYALDNAEPELEKLMEQAQDEDANNLALDQGKTRAFNHCSLSFILNLALGSI
jgi:hypothetical protein